MRKGGQVVVAEAASVAVHQPWHASWHHRGVSRDFDTISLHAAMDTRRGELGLSWSGVARALWEQSAELNRERRDHPIVAATLAGMPARGDTTCQHALFMLRWLDRTPESFVDDAVAGTDVALPTCGTDRRPRWHLHARARRPLPGLFEALNTERQERGLTWPALAEELSCSPNQLSGLRGVRYAIGMVLAMRITQWLERPAADFIYPAGW
jgi:hypothetical protein